MRRDAIAELYSIGRLLDRERGEMMIAEWLSKYVHQCSARQYSSLLKSEKTKDYQRHLDEKSIFDLTARVIADCSIDQVDETETANIKTKTIFVIGDRKNK